MINALRKFSYKRYLAEMRKSHSCEIQLWKNGNCLLATATNKHIDDLIYFLKKRLIKVYLHNVYGKEKVLIILLILLKIKGSFAKFSYYVALNRLIVMKLK